jgi:hypothetical protein
MGCGSDGFGPSTGHDSRFDALGEGSKPSTHLDEKSYEAQPKRAEQPPQLRRVARAAAGAV